MMNEGKCECSERTLRRAERSAVPGNIISLCTCAKSDVDCCVSTHLSIGSIDGFDPRAQDSIGSDRSTTDQGGATLSPSESAAADQPTVDFPRRPPPQRPSLPSSARMTDACCSDDANGVVPDALADDPAPAGDDALDVVPAPTMAEVDACRYVRWHAVERLRAHAFRSVVIPLPRDYVEYLLADGLSLAADSEAMPARVAHELDELVDSAFTPEDEADDALAAGDALLLPRSARASDAPPSAAATTTPHPPPPPPKALASPPSATSPTSTPLCDRHRPARRTRHPALTWSAPKDATWMATTNTTRCQNPGEIHLLLKASDAIAYDLQDASTRSAWTAPAADHPDAAAAVARLVDDAVLALRKWTDLNPSMGFGASSAAETCEASASATSATLSLLTVPGGMVGGDHRGVLAGERPRRVSRSRLLLWRVAHVAAQRQTGGFQPRGRRDAFLCCSSGGARGRAGGGAAGDGRRPRTRGFTDDLEFRVVTSQGHIRPGAQLGVPFDMYDRAPDSARQLRRATAQRDKRLRWRRRKGEETARSENVWVYAMEARTDALRIAARLHGGDPLGR